MSTKCTLDHGETFHLDSDMFRANTVILELHGVEFEARPSGVTVGIRLELWNRLRAKTADPEAYWWDDEEEATPPESEDQS
jgi:hypothetical protein